MRTRIILIGGENEARHLAVSLLDKGYHVTAINEDPDQCTALASIPKLTVFQGDGSKPFVLEDAGAYQADIAIALSPYDDANLVICELCKKKFKIRKTVALISDPSKTEFFHMMGVDSVVCATTTISNIIEQQALMNDLNTVMPLGDNGIQVAQLVIPETAASVGRRLWEIELPKAVIIGCIMRGNQSVIPRGDTRILAGDSLVLIVSDEDKETALKQLTQ